MGLKIGNTEFCHGLILAPMAGVTDRTFRNICKKYGAEYTVSEMVCAKSLCYEQFAKKKEYSTTAELSTIMLGDGPIGIQIFGSEPNFMAEAALMLAEGTYKNCISTEKPIAIDINMGCPVRKITANGEGSALMKNPTLAGEIVRAVVDEVSIPVTVKIRAGWDDSSKNAVELARVLEANGASAICVHARTKEQLYRPGIDIDIISQVKKAVNIPVIGNGDIYCAKDAVNMFNKTECDAIMIGRGAMGNPWIFKEITCALENKEYIPPSATERLSLALEQIALMIEVKGERIGIAEGKKHVGWYIAGMNGAAAARNRIMTSSSFDEIKNILEEMSI
ncbi:MAG: tRNA dihydrouridine synthase DusB [Ruminococcaceae bacterium]|nr:tRNA dihydrouridine synthase DusB [Oscillospiraceae bacterium]